MEKLVLELVELASKTASKQPLEHRCLAALSKLYTIPVSNGFLVSTNVGHAINTLKSNPRLHQVIRDHASRVLWNWKSQLYSKSSAVTANDQKSQFENPIPISPKPYCKTSESKKKPPKTVSETKNKPSNTHPENPILISKTKPPNKICESKSKTRIPHKLVSGSKLKKNVVSEPRRNTIVVQSDDGQLRSNIRQLVFNSLNMVLKETDLKSYDPIGISIAVESTLYDKWGHSNTINKHKYRSFLYNLKDPKNPDFRRMILMGEIEVERITELKPEDMASKERRILNNNIRQLALEKCIVGRST